MSDLTERVRRAEPRLRATPEARERTHRAAMSAFVSATDHRPRREGRPRALAFAGIGALGVAATVATVFLAAHEGGQSTRIVLPGDDGSPSAQQGAPAPAEPGIAATIVFEPVAGVSQDDAYAQMVRVIKTRAAQQKGVSATVWRVDRNQALVTLTGTREVTTLSEVVAGSSVAVYDLDDVLAGTFSSFRKAVLRARQLAPGAPSSVAYLFRNGRLVRGPAASAGDLRRLTRTLPPGSQILSLPVGYTILSRQYARDAQGVYARLRSAQFFVVRDQPVVSPLQVVGADSPHADPNGGGVVAAPVELTADGRQAWDALLTRVSARAAAAGRPQRIAVTTNGDVQQITVADASGALDTRAGSPALEFGGGISGRSGTSRVIPTITSVPLKGSIPALVWVADTFRVGPPPTVLGDTVDPLPTEVRRRLQARTNGSVDLSSVRRAVVADGPDGQWSVWNYLLKSGSIETLVIGPTANDGFSFTCGRMKKIEDCGGMTGFQIFAVPPATRVLRLTSPAGIVRDAVADNGWAIAVGPRVRPSSPPTVVRAVALDASGAVLAKQKGAFTIP